MPNAHLIGRVLPAWHQWPVGQSTHLVRFSFAYVPASHVVHRALRRSDATMPEAHSIGAMLPAGA